MRPIRSVSVPDLVYKYRKLSSYAAVVADPKTTPEEREYVRVKLLDPLIVETDQLLATQLVTKGPS